MCRAITAKIARCNTDGAQHESQRELFVTPQARSQPRRDYRTQPITSRDRKCRARQSGEGFHFRSQTRSSSPNEHQDETQRLRVRAAGESTPYRFRRRALRLVGVQPFCRNRLFEAAAGPERG